MPLIKFFAALVGAFVVSLMAFAVLTQPNHGGKSKAYYATLKADLRNLVTAQEAHFADSSRYATSLEAIGEARYLASAGVTVAITAATDSSWTATARHSGLPDGATCSIGIGVDDAHDGEPVCPLLQPQTRNWRFIWE